MTAQYPYNILGMMYCVLVENHRARGPSVSAGKAPVNSSTIILKGVQLDITSLNLSPNNPKLVQPLLV